ncbi:hypothetical protein EW146_g7481 [Bondarzewia mesenterica]|uniref:Uncharacterized protein n=1 Tax=Bondarzewia mesenterica TaxID=1095465 RepID=A0A4S4LL72_9AGAM|nr:hypothetical protein EW146_g7481 [Bondarzewia mesenterica]
MMISSFSSPVLSVTADAVKDLDGGDALSGLWNLFTKCKESLQDGRRLENISWRLWYREVAHFHSSRPSTPDTPSDGHNDLPLSPTSQGGRSAAGSSPSTSGHLAIPLNRTATDCHSDAPAFAKDHLSVSSASSVRPLSNRTKSSSPVGKIIIDMIPDKLDIYPRLEKPLQTLVDPSTTLDTHFASPNVDNCVVVAPVPSSSIPLLTPPPPTTPAPSVVPYALPTLGFKQTHLAPPARISAIIRTPANGLLGLTPEAPLALRDQSSPPVPPEPINDAVTAADRRVFLQQEESPSPERDSIGRGSLGTDKTPSDANGIEPSSLISDQTKASSASNKRQARGRKGKETIRHTTGRHTMHRFQTQRQTVAQRKAATSTENKARPTFNLGSNGSKVTPSGSSKHITSPREDSVSKPHTSSPQNAAVPGTQADAPRRGIVVSNSSSEYETDSDDDSWASEDASNEEESEQKKEEIRLREAALEAQRQREMFAKVPKRSYSNLNRTQSGLLSALLNPDPSRLPPGHSYRSNSSADVTRSRLSGAPVQLSTSKSAAALPLAAQITAQVATTNGAQDHRGYRLKGCPQGQEMEEDSDSGEENPDDGIQVSRSLAQQKLAALADPSRRRNSDRGGEPSVPPVRPILHTVATAPIPLDHPWNLPPPAAPSTPRTTRRQMLATELSESLRRNLLWERQVSKPAVGGMRRHGLLSGGLRPLTSTATTTPADATPAATTSSNETLQQTQQQDNGPEGSTNEIEDKEERKRRAMARNRSWADDYHYSGW